MHRFTLNIYKQNQHLTSQCTVILLPKFQLVFRKNFYFCCYVSLDSFLYFWGPARCCIAWTKREFATNAVLALGLFGFNAHRRASGFPWNITINGDKEGNPATKTAAHSEQLLHTASSAKSIVCIVFFFIFSCRNSTFRMQQHKVQAIQKRKKNLRHEVTTAT